MANMKGEFANVEWKLGVRYSYYNQTTALSSTEEDGAWSGFLHISRSFENGFLLFSHVSTGFRFPSLSERFFSGTTGRGAVVRNPNLKKNSLLILI